MERKKYIVIPTEWDYSTKENIKTIKALQKQSIYVPTEVEDVIIYCRKTQKTQNLTCIKILAKALKKIFPYIMFDIMEGDTFGELKTILSF